MLLLANMYQEGYGVEKDLKEAKRWLDKCAESEEDPFGSVAQAKELLKSFSKLESS